MNALLLLSLLLAPNAPGCWPVSGDHILARDLAAANPLFLSVDPELPLGFAPLPGTRRTFSGGEVAALAKKYGLPAARNQVFPNVCVERATVPLSALELRAALDAALGIDGVQMELLDFSRQPLPRGRLEFKINELNAPPAGHPDLAVTWRGRLVYDGQHSTAIWAKLRISVERSVVVAAQDLAPGREIQPQQIQVVRRREFPLRASLVEMPDQVVGKILARSLRAGSPIPSAALREPNEVARGDKVQVRVIDGAAHVRFEAVALSDGRTGDAVSLRNPANGKTFRGVVEEKGRAIVRPGGSV